MTKIASRGGGGGGPALISFAVQPTGALQRFSSRDAIDLMPDKSWRGMRLDTVTALGFLCISYAFPDCIRTLCKLFPLL